MSSASARHVASGRTRRLRARERGRCTARRRRGVLSVLPPVPRSARAEPRSRWLSALALGSSVIVHGLIAFVFANADVADKPDPADRWVMITTPTAEPEEKAPVAEPDPEPAPKPKPKQAKVRTRTKPEPSAPPVAETEVAPELAEPVAPVVGLSFESTVTGGSGPSFALGSTRMGRTEGTAREPKPTSAPVSAGFNRRASVRPGAGGDLVLPSRLREVEPEYPSDLRALGVEANVVVRVEIDRSGSVSSVQLVSRAKDDAFNQAARKAALKERFSPATLGGVETDYRLSFTYRFRLDG